MSGPRWRQGCGRPFPEPCLCGATDCPRCYPYSYDKPEEPEPDEPDEPYDLDLDRDGNRAADASEGSSI